MPRSTSRKYAFDEVMINQLTSASGRFCCRNRQAADWAVVPLRWERRLLTHWPDAIYATPALRDAQNLSGWRPGDQHCEPPQVLSDGRENKLVLHASWAAQSKSTESANTDATDLARRIFDAGEKIAVLKRHSRGSAKARAGEPTGPFPRFQERLAIQSTLFLRPATVGREPDKSVARSSRGICAFVVLSPDLRFASLMDMDFAVSGPLVRRSRLVPGSCPSTRTFALRFLQTSPHGDSPCVVTNPSPPSGWVEDFHLQVTEHAQHTTKPLAR
jgi:hypothetical protein